MKRCPVCHQPFTSRMLTKKALSKRPSQRLGEYVTDGRGVIRCPHCSSRLRKKISSRFILALIPYILSALLYMNTHRYGFLMYLSIAFFIIFYINLPYVPYDKK